MQIRESSHDTELNGLRLPAGTKVGINVLGMHHDPKHFPNPEVDFFLDGLHGQYSQAGVVRVWDVEHLSVGPALESMVNGRAFNGKGLRHSNKQQIYNLGSLMQLSGCRLLKSTALGILRADCAD